MTELTIKNLRTPNKHLIFKATVVLIFIISIFLRLIIFNQEGGDHKTYKIAVNQFLAGVNPYEYTTLSYQREDLKHGYAYMPTLLYVQSALAHINVTYELHQPTKHLWKIPVLIADIGVGIIIYHILKKKSSSYPIIIAGLLFWFFNPYFFMRYQYTNYETLPVFFLLLSLLFVGKKNFWAGTLFALAVTLKTFPIIFLPILLLKSKNPKKAGLFLLGSLLTGIIVILPFLKSVHDFSLLVNGSLLVHGSRGIQGRPFFSFLTYYLQNLGISFYQSEFSKVYTFVTLTGSAFLPLYLYFKKNVTNIWILVFFSLAIYFLFTPVLNRTHFIWITPFVYLGFLNIFKGNFKKHYLSITLYYLFICFYYFLWNKGFKNPVSFGGYVWIDPVFKDNVKFPFFNELYIKAIQLKKSLFG